MGTKYSLLQNIQKTAIAEHDLATRMVRNLKTLNVLVEDVTHVLAAISTAAREQQKIQLASAESLAAFLAGVEVLSQKLPASNNENMKQSVLRLMANIRVNPDQSLSANVQPVADLGAKHPDIMKRYLSVLKTYEYDPNEQSADSVSRVARMLQSEIDRALRMVLSSTRKK